MPEGWPLRGLSAHPAAGSRAHGGQRAPNWPPRAPSTDGPALGLDRGCEEQLSFELFDLPADPQRRRARRLPHLRIDILVLRVIRRAPPKPEALRTDRALRRGMRTAGAHADDVPATSQWAVVSARRSVAVASGRDARNAVAGPICLPLLPPAARRSRARRSALRPSGAAARGRCQGKPISFRRRCRARPHSAGPVACDGVCAPADLPPDASQADRPRRPSPGSRWQCRARPGHHVRADAGPARGRGRRASEGNIQTARPGRRPCAPMFTGVLELGLEAADRQKTALCAGMTATPKGPYQPTLDTQRTL